MILLWLDIVTSVGNGNFGNAKLLRNGMAKLLRNFMDGAMFRSLDGDFNQFLENCQRVHGQAVVNQLEVSCHFYFTYFTQCALFN